MAKQSTSGAPAFKAVSYKAPEPVSAVRRAAIYESFPVPVYMVMRTDWRLSKRHGKHPQQTTTVISAFTTLLSAQEAALIGFEKFVQEYQYADGRSADNRFSWYSRLHGKNKAHRDVKEIAEDMKTWLWKWKESTTEERYQSMLEAMEAVKPRLPSGSIFSVEKAALPPTARARAVNPIDPVPFRIFVLTQNHWSWSKSVDDTSILGVFTCLNQARVDGVDAYHVYIHSSDQERKRLKWDKTADDAYDKMLKNVMADKLTWEKTSREYGTSFSIDECYCYPRGAYFRYDDEVLPKVEDDSPLPRSEVSSMGISAAAEKLPAASSVPAPASAPAAVPPAPQFRQPIPKPAEQVPAADVSSSHISPRETKQFERVPRADVSCPASSQFTQRETKPVEQVPRANVSSPAPTNYNQRETKPADQVSRANFSSPAPLQFSQRETKRVEQVPRANAFSPAPAPPPPPVVVKENPYASVVQNAEEDGPRAHGFIRRTYAVNSEKKTEDDVRKSSVQHGADGAFLSGKKGILSSIRGSHLRGLETARARFYDRWKKDERDQGRSTSFVSRHGKEEPEQKLEAEGGERYGEVQGDEVGDPKRKKKFSDRELEKNAEDLDSVNQKEDVAQAWAQARARARARRAYAEDKEFGGDPDQHGFQGKKSFDGRDVRANVGTANNEKVVYHRAYGYVARDKSSRNLQAECKDELTSEGERADDEVSVQTPIYQKVKQRRRSDGEVHQDSPRARRSGKENIDGPRSNLYKEQERSARGKTFQPKGSETAGISEENYNPFENILEKLEPEEKVPRGHYNPFDDPPENQGTKGERNSGGYRNPFDDPSETEKISEMEYSNGDNVIDETEDPPLVRKPRKYNEKISKYLEDQLNCLLPRKGHRNEVPSDGHEHQTETGPAVLSSERREVVHSGQTHDRHERPVKVPSAGDGHRQNNGAAVRTAVNSGDETSDQVQDHRGYGFSSVGDEDVNCADADDPPLIRKARQRKGDDRYNGGASRREDNHRTESHFSGGHPKDMSCTDGEDVTTMKKSGVEKESWSRDIGLRGDSSRHGNPDLADCEVDQLEESSVEEQHVGARKEAPHLDLALKRHRAFMKVEEVSEEDFRCGRRPVDGGFKFGLIGRVKKILKNVTTVPEDWSD